MRFIQTTATALTAVALSAGLAFSAAHESLPVQTMTEGDLTYLVNAEKMTLYTFDKDAEGVSNCYDMCAVNWPPALLEGTMMLPEGYSVVERKDGAKQIAYKGAPLYGWFKDEKPGDMTGDGVKGVWHIARP